MRKSLLLLFICFLFGGSLFAQSLGKGSISTHSSAVSASGITYTWGENYSATLGNGNEYDNVNVAVDISTMGALIGKKIVSIANGEGYMLALDSEGYLYTWGYGSYEQFKNHPPYGSTIPIQVPGISDVKAIATGPAFWLALKNDGTVYIWGISRNGQQLEPNNAPVQIPGLTDIKDIAAGQFASLALKNDGTVFVWGNGIFSNSNAYNAYNLPDYLAPVQVTGLSDIKAISIAFFNFTTFLKNDGTVYTWDLSGANPPQQVEGLSDITKISTGFQFRMALKSDGTVYTWGTSSFLGTLGHGEDAGIIESPLAIPGLTDVIDISASYATAFALKKDGSVYGWGVNFSGELGIGTFGGGIRGRYYSPIQVLNLNLNDLSDPNDLASYVLIGFDDISMKANEVKSGSVGIIEAGKQVKLEEATTVTAQKSFVLAPNLDLKSGSEVTDFQVGNVAVDILPDFREPTTSCKSKIDIKDNGGVVVLNQGCYGDIKVGKNSQVLFVGQATVNIKSLKLDDNASVSFNQSTDLLIENYLDANKYVTISSNGHPLRIFTGGDVKIGDGSDIAATIYSKKQLKVSGNQAPTTMSGLFIARKVNAESNVYWMAGSTQPGSSANTNPQARQGVAAGMESEVTSELSMEIYPNPASQLVNIRLEGIRGNAVASIYSLTGNILWKKEVVVGQDALQIDLTNQRLRAGQYLISVYSETQRVTKKLVIVE